MYGSNHESNDRYNIGGISVYIQINPEGTN